MCIHNQSERTKTTLLTNKLDPNLCLCDARLGIQGPFNESVHALKLPVGTVVYCSYDTLLQLI